jgi:DNA-binding Xre family transcriptional regulator
MVLGDRRMKVREIAETTGISKEHVEYIWHEELDMKKLVQDGCCSSQQIKNKLA